MASIQVIQGPEKGRTFDLMDGENIIGRQSRAIPLGDGTVSRNHARMTPQNGTWLLEDLGSANGTYLNGVKITKPSPLKQGDQIRCGSTLLIFLAGPHAGLTPSSLEIDEKGQLVDAAIVATMPSNEDSVIIPTPEAGAEAIGNLRILYDLIAEVGSILNTDLLLQRTLDKAFEIVHADRGYIMLIDERGGLTLKASRLPEDAKSKEIPISRTIINEVVSKEVGVLSSNAMTDKRFAPGKSVHDFGIRSAICAPIKGRERILGVIHMDCSVSDHTYDTEQLRLLTAIGYQTGLAIENVALHDSVVQSERLAAVGETVALLSHHIKNILQALGAGADVVETGLKADDIDKARNSWPIVRRNLARINEMILNMLAFSKAREPLLENVNVNHLLGECLELVAARADEQGMVILDDLDELPPLPADAAGLHQAILNLLTNALDAIEDAAGVITVASKYDSLNRNVVVTVTDNGKGIPKEHLGRIFTPFYSAKGQKGTGLGLAVTQKVVTEHGGTIEVVSKVGEGTTFTITLPIIPREQANGSDTDSPAKPE